MPAAAPLMPDTLQWLLATGQPEQLMLLLHGGGAPALRSGLPAAVAAPSLVLEGLACWARLEQAGTTTESA